MLADYCTLPYNKSLSYYKRCKKITKFSNRFLYRSRETLKVAVDKQTLQYIDSYNISIRNMRCHQENTSISRHGVNIPTLKDILYMIAEDDFYNEY